MKKLLPVVTVVVLLLSLSLAFVGCSAEDKIIGTWGEGDRYQFTVREDGTWSYSDERLDARRWTYDKKTKTYSLWWDLNGDGSREIWTATINKDGDLVRDSGSVYKRVKE